MTREGLSDLLHAAEHSLTLRGQLKNCSNDQELIDLAKDYGFPVKLCDLQNEAESQQIEDWFRKSRISPIRKWLAWMQVAANLQIFGVEMVEDHDAYVELRYKHDWCQ